MHLRANFIGSLSVISWGLYSALTKKSGVASGAGAAVKYYQLTFICFAPLLLISPPLTMQNPMLTMLLFSLCVAMNFVGYICWDYGMRHGNIVILSLTADFIPWISLAFTSLIHDIEIHSHTILSAVLLVFGAMITRTGTIQRTIKNEQTLF